MEAKKEIEEKLRAEFKASPKLQNEFGSVESYIAYRRYEARVEQKIAYMDRRRRRKNNIEIDVPKLVAEFEKSQTLQDEFSDVSAFLALKKAEAAGQVKVYSGHGVSAFSSAPAPDMEKAVARAEEIRRDELEQYSHGVPCNANGVLVES